MNYTTNLGLKKPEQSDFYDVDDFNDNADKVDAAFQDLGGRAGQPNGFATLDGDGRIPYDQLPESAMEYKGTWNASTNIPHVEDGTGTNGDFYIVSVAGTFGGVAYAVNDRIIYDGTQAKWIKLAGGSVSSVAGRTGAVTLTAPDIGAGTLAGRVQANTTAQATLANTQVRNIYAGTTDMTAGTTTLASGSIYIMYEA